MVERRPSAEIAWRYLVTSVWGHLHRVIWSEESISYDEPGPGLMCSELPQTSTLSFVQVC